MSDEQHLAEWMRKELEPTVIESYVPTEKFIPDDEMKVLIAKVIDNENRRTFIKHAPSKRQQQRWRQWRERRGL